MRKVEDVKVEISLGFSGHEIVEFRILRRVSRAHDLGHQDTSALQRDCSCSLPWNKALNGKGAQESCLIFKDYVLQGQE